MLVSARRKVDRQPSGLSSDSAHLISQPSQQTPAQSTRLNHNHLVTDSLLQSAHFSIQNADRSISRKQLHSGLTRFRTRDGRRQIGSRGLSRFERAEQDLQTKSTLDLQNLEIMDSVWERRQQRLNPALSTPSLTVSDFAQFKCDRSPDSRLISAWNSLHISSQSRSMREPWTQEVGECKSRSRNDLQTVGNPNLLTAENSLLDKAFDYFPSSAETIAKTTANSAATRDSPTAKSGNFELRKPAYNYINTLQHRSFLCSFGTPSELLVGADRDHFHVQTVGNTVDPSPQALDDAISEAEMSLRPQSTGSDSGSTSDNATDNHDHSGIREAAQDLINIVTAPEFTSYNDSGTDPPGFDPNQSQFIAFIQGIATGETVL